MVIVGLGEVCHQVLRALWELAGKKTWGPRKDGECWDDSLWGEHRVVLDHAAVFQHTTPSNHAVLADVDEGTNVARIDNGPFTNEDVVADLKRKEGNTLAELLERRPNDRPATYDTVPPDPHVRQVATYDRFRLNNRLSVEDDVVATAENRISADFVAGRGFNVVLLVIPHVDDIHLALVP